MQRLYALACRIALLIALGLYAFQAARLASCYPAFFWIALLGVIWRLTRRRWRVSDAFGSAAFADWDNVARYGMLGDKGLVLGRTGLLPRPTRGAAVRSLVNPFIASERACRECLSAFLRVRPDGFIRIHDYTHLLTCSPAGGGKTVSTLGPVLLSFAGNCVVVDPKGELFALTAEHRRKRFGHQIVRLDPARLFDKQHGPGDRLNPLDWIDPASPRFIDLCRDLANMAVARSGTETEPHWNDSAENVIAAFCAFICACEGNPAARNLRGMRTYLASRPLYAQALEIMQQKAQFHGVLQQLGHSLTWHVDRELGSVMSHTQRHTSLFDSPLVAEATERTTFDPGGLRTGRMTVYLIVPSDLLVVWAALQRVWLGTLIRLVTRGVPSEKNPVLFLVDECAHVGQMQALTDAITLMRGMGIRCWLFFQSLDQLNRSFGDHASTVLDNLTTQQFYSISSMETCEALSKRLGDATTTIVSENDNNGSSIPVGGISQHPQPGSRSWGRGSTVSEHGRPLLRPDEVRTLPSHASIIFHKNRRPIMAERIRYYADPAFRRRWHGFGTGRARDIGVRGLVLSLAALGLACLLTALAKQLPALRGRPDGPSSYPYRPAGDDLLGPYDDGLTIPPPLPLPVPIGDSYRLR